MTSDYLARVHSLLDEMAAANESTWPEAAGMIARSIGSGGILHVFGSGHSAMLAQEIFYRAGGLAPVNAMLDINLTIFGTSRPTWVERLEGYAESIFASYDVQPGEVLMIISNSGINAVPVEMALGAKARGMTTIAIGSRAAYANAASRHSSGKTLFDIADVVLDTCVPAGDAVIDLPGHDTPIGAVSTVLGAALLNELVVRVAAGLQASGSEVPVFTSQNVPGGDEANASLVDRYRPRIPLMKP
jgi:uncharacterized phosphosugar-binding protein